MAKFSEAYAETMSAEGGYAFNPADKGGETYKGIARKYNPTWKGWPILDAIKPHTPANINKVAGSNPTLQEYVKAFYHVNYWDINKLGDIIDQQLANNVFDFGVNAGTKTAAKMLQRAYNYVTTELTVDGIIGSKTMIAINGASAEVIYNKFNDFRRQFYDAIIARDPSQAQFRKSWYSRIKPHKKS